MQNKYSRENLIGHGTFGNVWLVRSTTNGNTYVLKEIKLSSMNEAERQQSLTEVSVLAKCKHKNIIRYKEAAFEPETCTLSIVMEYAEAGDLYTAIANRKGVPFKEHLILNWFIQITFALQYIHDQNILHRDLKTPNIFLTRNDLIKIGDFGISRILREPGELVTTTIGTPYYLSPEICRREPYNQKSDIWALGCVLFEMAALTHPFDAKNFPQLVHSILKAKVKPLPRHNSLLIQDLVSIMLKLEPSERPSATDILSIPSLQEYVTVYLEDNSTQDERPKPCTLNEYSANTKQPAKRRASTSDNDLASRRQATPTSKAKQILKPKSFSTPRYNAGNASRIRSKIAATRRLEHKFASPQFKCKTESPNPACTTYSVSKLNSIQDNQIPGEMRDADCGYHSEEKHVALSNNGCEHSSCHLCILNVLWKNRIRSTPSLVDREEKLCLEKRLQSVFGIELMDKMRAELAREWSYEQNSLPKIVQILNFEQLQHLPLLLQLMQLDGLRMDF